MTNLLSGTRYAVIAIDSPEELIDEVEQNQEKIDCLILFKNPVVLSVVNQLYEQGILLPVIIIEPDKSSDNNSNYHKNFINSEAPTFLYHSGEIRLEEGEVDGITSSIERAISQFLHLAPSCSLSEKPNATVSSKQPENKQNLLFFQQRRLAEKLKERLGYLGVFYNRNPQFFYRHLEHKEKQEFLKQLNLEYREIILNYFSDDEEINQSIDQFVHRAFFADISVSQILEIHMELMDEFAQQLKIEGRSEEILLDYRLALIDTIAHLCEMYRRSIPREDIPFDLLFSID